MNRNSTTIEALRALNPGDPEYAPRFVDLLLAAGRERGASDLHLQPTAAGLELRWRVDGVLANLGTLPAGTGSSPIARLKVLAGLLTYRTDVPQEGRIRNIDGTDNDGQPSKGALPGQIEFRVSTFPTLYGERATVRLFAVDNQLQRLADLSLPETVEARLRRWLAETSGAILVVGPAGSGKTTTLYACLRELIADPFGLRSVLTLEDPIEVVIPGASQSQVNPAAGFDMASGLRSALRQDPQVIMIGEIRDPDTAHVALEASLTGQLVLSSFHAGSPAEAVGRLLDMGVEPYIVRSGLAAVVYQRLLRRLCSCAQENSPSEDALGLAVERTWRSVGCDACGGSGYRGRWVVAEMLAMHHDAVSEAVLAKRDVGAIAAAAAHESEDRWAQACRAVNEGITTPSEVRRVLGFGERSR